MGINFDEPTMDEMKSSIFERLTKNKEEQENDLLDWPCQHLHGGTGPMIYENVDGNCTHPECHPSNFE